MIKVYTYTCEEQKLIFIPSKMLVVVLSLLLPAQLLVLTFRVYISLYITVMVAVVTWLVSSCVVGPVTVMV